MAATLPPIYRDCRRLLLHTEEVVRRFSRYHKYTVGADLRQQAMAVMRGVHRAVYDKGQQSSHVHTLVWRVDDYKLTLQLAMELGAFVTARSSGFAAFEAAAQLAAAVGKQCGGWQKKATTKTSYPGQSQTSSESCSQATGAQAPAKTASSQHAQAGNMGGAASLHPMPAAGQKLQAQPAASPASLSAPAARTLGSSTNSAANFMVQADMCATLMDTQGVTP